MSGWWVVVDARTHEEREASADKRGHQIASWETGLSGVDFLTRGLVKGGKAAQYTFGGYPNRFTVAAGDLVPFIIDGPPKPEGGWIANVTINREKLAELPPEQVLTVEVWDIT